MIGCKSVQNAMSQLTTEMLTHVLTSHFLCDTITVIFKPINRVLVCEGGDCSHNINKTVCSLLF